MTILLKKELALIAEFLRQYSSRLGNDGCNDWDFPDDWDSTDIALFRTRLKEMDGSDPDNDWKSVHNWCAVDCLAEAIEKSIKEIGE